MSSSPTPRIETPEDLRRLMGAEFAPAPEQWAAVKAELSPAVVIAGAGSGKTTLMAARVVYLVASGAVTPDQVLGLTFTTKAAAELRARIDSALVGAGLLPAAGTAAAADVVGPTAATYNAYAAGLVREHALRIGHEPDARLLSEGGRHQLAVQVVTRHRSPIRWLSGSASTVARQVLGLDGQLNEHLCPPSRVREFQQPLLAELLAERPAAASPSGVVRSNDLDKLIETTQRRAELLGLVEEYREAKRRLGLIDFSDQISLAARIAAECPEVGAGERDRFRVVLLDEYQDTSVAQAELLSSLFSGPDVEHGLGHPVMAVGDPNQAIYGWRGASASNIIRFDRAFPRADGQPRRPFQLTTNWRSERRILEVANRVSAELFERPESTSELEPRPGAGAGQVEVALHETDTDELAALPDAVRQARATAARGEWRNIAVLTRNNAVSARAYEALADAGVPVEIVGLKGLLSTPEVATLVDVLTVLEDPTANSALLHLLTGPQWAIGARDLALLARRATELAGGTRPRSEEERTIEEQLDEIAVGSDPTEVAALLDALEDPGQADYSEAARLRFVELAGDIRHLRSFTAEPLPDLVRRVLEVTGIEIEVGASLSERAEARLDNIDAFLTVVADFRPVDGPASLAALLSYLDVERGTGSGLEIPTPTDHDSVKLLTVHRAKGLEWDAVFLVGVTDKKFPDDTGQAKWITTPEVLPHPLRGDAADLPPLHGVSREDLEQYRADCSVHDEREERRLGYVAFTRAKRLLVVSGCWWRGQNKKPNGPSEFLVRARRLVDAWGEQPRVWDEIEDGAENPQAASAPSLRWPFQDAPDEVERRRAGAALVRLALDGALPPSSLTGSHQDLVDTWDSEINRLLEHHLRREEVVEVPRPASLSATSALLLEHDPDAFLESIVRPMPRRPSPAARFGTRFHAWVERHLDPQAADPLVDPDDLPGRLDTDVLDETDLRDIAGAFLDSEFARRADARVEVPFALSLGAHVVRGRIDAVFPEGDGWLVVDWKTNRQHDSDPLQLAFYREAWADLSGAPVESIRAAFFYVRSGTLVEPADLPDRAALEQLVSGSPHG